MKCPDCGLDVMSDDPELQVESRDGKRKICAICGRIEAFEAVRMYDEANGIRLSQKKAKTAFDLRKKLEKKK